MTPNSFRRCQLRKSRARRPLARHFRPLVEQLETRSLLATIAVNTTLMALDPADTLCTLKEAIIAANANVASGLATGECVAGASLGTDIITIPAGTYTLTVPDHLLSGTDPVGLPDIVSSITFQGDGAGTTIIERSSAAGTPNFRILYIAPNVGDVTINDLTLRNGSSPASGGALFIFANENSLAVNRSVFDGNKSAGFGGAGGGAIENFNNAPFTLTDSLFTNNTTGGPGGAIDGRATVINSTFVGNQATGDGGAIACVQGGCPYSVTNSTFANNTAGGNGGALRGGTLTVSGTVFMGNNTTGGFGSGGAISAGPNSSILNSLFENNATVGTQADGGAIVGNGLTIAGSTFKGNRAGSTGGAVAGGANTIVNSTFSGNTATGNGGAIYSANGNRYNNITVTGNSTTAGRGGGINFGSSEVIQNTLIAGNSSGPSNTPDCSTLEAIPTSNGHNLIGVNTNCGFTAASGDQFGTNASPIDPKLGPLADNDGLTAGSNIGGQTPQVIPTHALLANSPALDAGDGNTPGSGGPACEATDQRGVARPLARSAGFDAVCDIGAGEFIVQPTNQPPVLAAIGNKSVDEESALIFSPAATDLDLPAQSLTFTLDTGAPAGASITAGGEFSWTPTENQGPGSYSITVRVTDSGTPALDDFETFAITVNEINALQDTQTTISSSFNPSGFNQSITFTATVTGTNGPATEGTVTFKEGTTIVGGPVAVDSAGKASFSISTLGFADHIITAEFSGSGNLNPSLGSVTQMVLPGISINDVSIAEGDEPLTRAALFTVELSSQFFRTVTVNYATANGAAIASLDYVIKGGTITFVPGITTQTIGVVIRSETLNEANENFFVNLTSAVNAVITDPQGLGTITNDDPLPTVAIGDNSVPEGNPATRGMFFTVRLSAPSGRTITMRYDTADDTAVNTSDYVSQSGVLTFNPGEIVKSVLVPFFGDDRYERNETFLVVLSDLTNVTAGDLLGVGTIRNDDPFPSITISGATVTEPVSGTVNMVFATRLSALSDVPAIVNFATANTTASAGADYVAKSGRLTFQSGEQFQTITVQVKADTLVENIETFVIRLSNAVQATLANDTGTGTIYDISRPHVLALNPAAAAVGATVTITGQNFDRITGVRFNGIGAPFTVLSPTSIRAIVPSGATTGRVGVSNARGIGTSPVAFVVLPKIATFFPLSGTVGTTVTINGTTFTGATKVLFNGAEATIVSISSTQIRATVPPDATTGPITVVTPAGVGPSVANFRLLPSITSFTPASGPVGTEVTITGQGFVGTTAVRFNNRPAGSFTVDSPTSIRATVPFGATGRIRVSTPGGTVSSLSDFTVTSTALAQLARQAEGESSSLALSTAAIDAVLAGDFGDVLRTTSKRRRR